MAEAELLNFLVESPFPDLLVSDLIRNLSSTGVPPNLEINSDRD